MSIIKDAKVRQVGDLVPLGEFHWVLDLEVKIPEGGTKTVTLKIDGKDWADLMLHLDAEDVLKWVEHHIKS